MKLKKLKRAISGLLAMALSFTILPSIPILADENEAVYNYDGYSVAYQVKNEWIGNQSVEVKLTNTGNDSILNWTLKYDATGEINGIWNGAVNEQVNTEYVVKNSGYNYEIEPNQSVTFGYTLSGSKLSIPKKFEIYSKRVDITDGYDVKLNIIDPWDTGFQGELVLTNTSDKPLEAWTLTFDSNFVIDNLWNGRILDSSDGHYIVASQMWTNPIQPGANISIGISTTHNVDVLPNIENCKLSIVKIDGLVNEDDIIEDAITELINAYDGLKIIYSSGDSANFVTKNITLSPKFGHADIAWQSNNESIVSNQGTIVRSSASDLYVKLIATISCGEYTIDKEFTIKVIAGNDIDNYINEHLDSIIECTDIEMLYYYNDDIDELQIYLYDNGYIKRIEGSFSDNVIDSSISALFSLYYIKSLIGSTSPKDDFVFSNQSTGAFGEYYTFNQMYKGIPVYNMSVRIGTSIDGYTNFLNSSFAYGINVSTTPSLNVNEIQNIISQQYTITSTPELVIYTFNDTDGSRARLAWNCYVTSESFIGNIIIDANNGDLLFENSIPSEVLSSYQGTGTDFYGNTVTFNTSGLNVPQASSTPVIYYLQDLERNIIMYDTSLKPFDDTIGSYGNKISNGASAATDWSKHNPEIISTYVNVTTVHDYFNNKFNYIVNKNDPLHISFDKSCNNNSYAYGWIPVLRFGGPSSPNTNGGYINYAGTDIDTVAHEFTHAMVYDIATTIGKNYSNASGAINEGYADVFALFIKGVSSSDWLYRDKNTYGQRAARNLTNPSEFSQPSKIGILNDSNYHDFTTNTFDYGGVHTNNTIISHAAYLMWKDVISDTDLLAEIWFESLNKGYSSNAQFSEVRANILSAAKSYKLSNADINKINAVFDEMCYPKMTQFDTTGSNLITGRVVETNTTLNVAGMPAISDVTVSLFRKSSKNENLLIGNTTTNNSGDFSFDSLLPGSYELYFYKADHLQTIQYVIINSTNYIQNTTTVELISSVNYSGFGNASGKVSDSITTNGVEGLTLNIRKGIDNFYSTSPILTIKTGVNGIYQISNLDAGHYTIEIVDNRILSSDQDRYITSHFNIKVLGGTSVSGQNATVSTSLNPGQLRIVLTWGITPRDLDSHLTGPTYTGGAFHVYYGSKSYSYGDRTIANLDLDNTSGYGPETTTIYDPADGTYTFYVYNYSGSPAITTSDATVKVYLGNNTTPSHIFNIPTTGAGRYWTVFRYKYDATTRTITPINLVGNSIL